VKVRNLKKGIVHFTFGFFLLLPATLFAQQTEPADTTTAAPAPPTEVVAFDTPNDAGGSITIQWGKSPDDIPEDREFVGYRILRAVHPEGEFEQTASAPAGAVETFDNEATDGVEYIYKIRGVKGELFSDSEASAPAQSRQQWFHTGRLNALIGCLIIGLAIIFFISRARAGKELYIRKIAGWRRWMKLWVGPPRWGERSSSSPAFMTWTTCRPLPGLRSWVGSPSASPNTTLCWRSRSVAPWSW